MARRNKGGVGLLAALGAAGAATWLLLRGRPKPKRTTAWPGEAQTGWAVNELCTNADLTDPEQAVVHAYAWRTQQKLPPAVSPAQIEGALAAYFASLFPQCAESVPDSVFHADGMLSWDDWVTAVAARGPGGGPNVVVGPSTEPLVDAGAAIVGY
jgi:hypothetical protein